MKNEFQPIKSLEIKKKFDSNQLIFDLKLTAEISANLIKVKGPFTILTEVDHRVSANFIQVELYFLKVFHALLILT